MKLAAAITLLSRLQIRDRDTNRSVPFILNPNQRILLSKLQKLEDENKPLWFMSLKARRVGVSSITDGLMLAHCLAFQGMRDLIVAHEQSSSDALFDVPLSLLESMPSMDLGRSTKTLITIPHAKGKSTLKVKTAGNVKAGRGFTLDACHLSEAAYYKNAEIFTSLINAVAYKTGSIVCIESTANGMDGEGKAFYQYWLDAEKGKNEFLPIFLSWLSDPACRRDPLEAPDAPLDDDEREVMDDFHADKGQIAWMRWAISTRCNGDVLTFHREYPWSAHVAFLATGDPAFLPDELRYARSLVIPPKWRGSMELSGDKPVFKRHDRGGLLVWEKPQPRAEYFIGADACKGLDGGDYAAIVVWRADGEQVAAYEERLAPELFGPLLNSLGLWYNEAMVNIELTGGYGRHAQTILRDTYNYWNLYRWKGRDDKRKRGGGGATIGWETTTTTRELMFAAFRVALRQKTIKPHQESLVAQMEKVKNNDQARWTVEVGHDDVLCAGQFGWVARHQYATPEAIAGVGYEGSSIVPGSPAESEDPAPYSEDVERRPMPRYQNEMDNVMTLTRARASAHTRKIVNWEANRQRMAKLRGLET